jgi:hypothetical protein
MGLIETAVVLLSGAVAWNLASAQTSTTAAPAHWLTYQSHDLFYLIDYRSDWEFVEQDGSNEVKFKSGNVSVSVAVENNDDNNTVEQFLEMNKSLLLQQCSRAEIKEEGKTTVAGVPGAYFTMVCPGPGLPTLVRISASLSFGKLFILNVTSPRAELPKVQAGIDRMVQSFKVGDGLPEGREPRKRAR